MPFKIQTNGGSTISGAAEASVPVHTSLRPITASVGHYRVTHRCALVNTQAANSRLFEVRNNGSNIIIPTRMVIRWLQTGTHTAAIEDSLDVYRVTNFTAVDTTNTVTLTGSPKRTSMSTAPGNALLRGVTVAGAAAGMTGGTLTLDSAPFAQIPKWLLAAVPTADVPALPQEVFDDVNGAHPFALAQNEGIVVANRVLLGAAAGSQVYIDFNWCEVAAY